METPSFDYSKMPNQDRTPGNHTPQAQAGQLAPSSPVVESASASTAPQTNSSNSAYVITGVTLGVVSLLALALTWLMYMVLSTAYTSSHAYDSPYGDPYDYWSHELDDEDLEWLERELLEDELLNDL